MLPEVSPDVRRYLLIFLIFALAGETIWVNLQNIELKKSISIGDTGLHPGDPAPSFELSSLEGQPFRLEDVRGAPVILVYLPSGCKGCEDETSLWKCLYESKGSSGSFMFGISNSKPEIIKPFLSQHGLEFPVLFDSIGSFASAYHVGTMPAIIRIDGAGRIENLF